MQHSATLAQAALLVSPTGSKTDYEQQGENNQKDTLHRKCNNKTDERQRQVREVPRQ